MMEDFAVVLDDGTHILLGTPEFDALEAKCEGELPPDAQVALQDYHKFEELMGDRAVRRIEAGVFWAGPNLCNKLAHLAGGPLTVKRHPLSDADEAYEAYCTARHRAQVAGEPLPKPVPRPEVEDAYLSPYGYADSLDQIRAYLAPLMTHPIRRFALSICESRFRGRKNGPYIGTAYPELVEREDQALPKGGAPIIAFHLCEWMCPSGPIDKGNPG